MDYLRQFFTLREYTGYPKMAYHEAMGGYCMSLGFWGMGAKIPLGSAKSEIYIAFRAMPSQDGAGDFLLAPRLSTTNLGALRRFGMGGSTLQIPYLAAYRNLDSTLLQTSTSEFVPVDRLYAALFEIYYKPHSSSGRWIVKVNGVTAIDYTGNTVPGSESTVDSLWFGDPQYTRDVYWLINDIVVDDANWPGHYQMAVLPPTGAGNSTQWDPTTSPNWDCVNEQPPLLTGDYNKTNTSDEKDSFAAQNLPAAAAAVNGVSVIAHILKEGSPTPTQVKALVRTGSTPTDYVGSGVAADTVPKVAQAFWAVNPYTSTGWTLDEVNGMEVGYQAVA